jgi:hypothetical protein
MDNGHLIFPEKGPFALPATQRATAREMGGSVQVTLYVIVPDQGQSPAPVRTAMTISVARQLASDLQAAALQAEQG